MTGSYFPCCTCNSGRARTSLAYLREERANPGETRNMCVISSNHSVGEWQEQVCSPVFSARVGWTLFSHRVVNTNHTTAFSVSPMPMMQRNIWQMKLLGGWRGLCCHAYLMIHFYSLPYSSRSTCQKVRLQKCVISWNISCDLAWKRVEKHEWTLDLLIISPANNNNNVCIYTLGLIRLSKYSLYTHCSANIKHVAP